MRQPSVLIKTRFPIQDYEHDFCVAYPRKIQAREVSYEFDRILAHDENLFDAIGRDLVDYFRHGNNACVLAYGPSGTGKSHTMLGTKTNSIIQDSAAHTGLLQGVLEEIFRQKSSDALLKIGCLEVYRESLFDLSKKNRVPLKLRVANNLAFLPDLETTFASDYDESVRVTDKLIESRRTRATKINDQSSRSHVIFVLELHSRQSLTAARLCVVDLAGSERASASQASGELFEDAKHINLSLTVLGNIISNLTRPIVDNQTANPFLRYRDHKLTHFLQPCLMSYTIFLCCINPTNFAESLHTLQFAAKAANIKYTAEKKVVASSPANNDKQRIEILERLLQEKDLELSGYRQELEASRELVAAGRLNLPIIQPLQIEEDSEVESPILPPQEISAPALKRTPRIICHKKSSQTLEDAACAEAINSTHFLCEFSGGLSATPNYNLASSSDEEELDLKIFSPPNLSENIRPVQQDWSSTADNSTDRISSIRGVELGLDQEDYQCYQSILKNISLLTERLGLDALSKAEQMADRQLELLESSSILRRSN